MKYLQCKPGVLKCFAAYPNSNFKLIIIQTNSVVIEVGVYNQSSALPGPRTRPLTLSSTSWDMGRKGCALL